MGSIGAGDCFEGTWTASGFVVAWTGLCSDEQPAVHEGRYRNMTSPRTITPIAGTPYKMGNEDTNEEGLASILAFVDGTGDRVLHHTTFDFGLKVVALTLQGIVLADQVDSEGGGAPSIWANSYSDLHEVNATGHDREIRLVFQDGGDVTWRMGDAPTVSHLRQIIRQYRQRFLDNGDPQLWEVTDGEEYVDGTGSSDGDQHGEVGDEKTPIAERVRFWQEQDRINQALIPRVIRQSELLAKHIAEHDDLPQLLGRVISEALAEQATQYEAALEKVRAEMRTAYDDALAKAKEQQGQDYEKAVYRVQEQAQQFRKRHVFLASSAVVVAVVAVVVAVLV